MTVAAVTLAAAVLLGELMGRIHELLPVVFPAPADYPMLDAITTVMSFTAMWLLARRAESWVYWIVDVVAVWLYWVTDVRLLSFIYVFLLLIASTGSVSGGSPFAPPVPASRGVRT